MNPIPSSCRQNSRANSRPRRPKLWSSRVQGQQLREATHYFVAAKRLDPALLKARLYLATAHASHYVPGSASPENIRYGTEAVSEFRETPRLESTSLSAIDGLDSILFQMAGTPFDPDKFVESSALFKKHSAISPNDPEPYYWVGVVDWTLAYNASKQLRARLNKNEAQGQLKDVDPLPADARAKYRADFGRHGIDEGIDCMKKAIALRPDYDDAMAYLNLLYRRKADAVADESERSHLIKMADDLVEKVKVSSRNRRGSKGRQAGFMMVPSFLLRCSASHFAVESQPYRPPQPVPPSAKHSQPRPSQLHNHAPAPSAARVPATASSTAPIAPASFAKAVPRAFPAPRCVYRAATAAPLFSSENRIARYPDAPR